MSKHPYFYPVKKSHLVSMQELWGAIKAGEKSTSYFPKFKRDIIRAGELHLPQERQVRAWAKDVTAGLIPWPSAVGEQLPSDFEATSTPVAVSNVPKKKVGKKTTPIDKSAYEPPVADPTVDAPPILFIRDLTDKEVETIKAMKPTIAHVEPPEYDAAMIPLGRGRIENPVQEEGPVKDAVDIIVNHYQEKAFATARKEAAVSAAMALRYFADKVEASA